MFFQGLEYFSKGGLMMYPLLVCSLTVVIISAERFIYYRANDKGLSYGEAVRRLTGRGDTAALTAASGDGALGEFVSKVVSELPAVKHPEEYITIQGEKTREKFAAGLSYLEVAVSLAPVLGLLGTVTGMIASFNALDVRMDNPMAVTAGIGEALITTVFGLSIAVMGICSHAYFSRRLHQVELTLEEIANALLEAHCAR
ncbi:MAG: MotA/TolQ/ExbB proton channel family protein [Selenomonadaceae bacterium]|nr:MotA/TolQ/ExbB proton channel family protein [Selenomonadaceae bacterium]